MHTATAPRLSWRTAALATAAWALLGVLFLVEEVGTAQADLSPALVFRRMIGPLLGAALTPFGFQLARRFRVESPHRLRHAAVHALAGVSITLATFTLLYFVHRGMGTLAPIPLSAWLASTAHEGLLYYAVVVMAGHLLFSPATPAPAPAAAPAPAPAAEHITLKLRDRTLLVAPAEVAWIEADGHHVVFHLVRGERHTVRDTLSRLEVVLGSRGFARVHRSTLVNVAQVKELRPWFAGDSLIFLKDGSELRLSRRYAGRLQGVLHG